MSLFCFDEDCKRRKVHHDETLDRYQDEGYNLQTPKKLTSGSINTSHVQFINHVQMGGFFGLGRRSARLAPSIFVSSLSFPTTSLPATPLFFRIRRFPVPIGNG